MGWALVSGESSIDWGRGIESLSEKSLNKLYSQELLDYQQRLVKAIDRRAFLLTDRGYSSIVDFGKQRIEQIQAEIDEFVSARELYPQQITQLNRHLDRCREQMVSRSNKRNEVKKTKSNVLSEDRVEKIKSKHGLTDEILSQMKALGVDPSLVIRSLA